MENYQMIPYVPLRHQNLEDNPTLSAGMSDSEPIGWMDIGYGK